jgi:hypothetical protein
VTGLNPVYGASFALFFLNLLYEGGNFTTFVLAITFSQFVKVASCVVINYYHKVSILVLYFFFTNDYTTFQ